MSTSPTTKIAYGYRVQSAENGGWILTDNYEFNERAKILGAFTNADDLLQHLTSEHKRVEAIRDTRVASSPAQDSELLDVDLKQAPIGKYRLHTYTWKFTGQEKVPATQIRNDVFADLDVARRAGIVECESGYFAFIYDDQGKLVAEVKP